MKNQMIDKPAEKERKLKPCPFCGYERPFIWDLRSIGQKYKVSCRRCMAQIGGNETITQAIISWNRRAEQK